MYTHIKVTTFKERFSDLCGESSMTDSRIADALKVSKQTVSAWKVGTRSPKEITINTIAHFFHVNIEWLMGFDVPKYEEPDSPHESTPRERLLSILDRIPEDQVDLVLRIVQQFLADEGK